MASTSHVNRKIRVSTLRFLSMCLILTAFLLLVRIYDLAVVSNLSGYPAGSWKQHLFGFVYDLLLALRISLWLSIPLIAIGYYSRIIQKLSFIIFASLIILSELALIQYFAVARVPLGADIFAYTRDEMMNTINASGQLSFSKFLPFLAFLAAIVVAFIKIPTITIGYFTKKTMDGPIRSKNTFAFCGPSRGK